MQRYSNVSSWVLSLPVGALKQRKRDKSRRKMEKNRDITQGLQGEEKKRREGRRKESRERERERERKRRPRIHE